MPYNIWYYTFWSMFSSLMELNCSRVKQPFYRTWEGDKSRPEHSISCSCSSFGYLIHSPCVYHNFHHLSPVWNEHGHWNMWNKKWRYIFHMELWWKECLWWHCRSDWKFRWHILHWHGRKWDGLWSRAINRANSSCKEISLIRKWGHHRHEKL